MLTLKPEIDLRLGASFTRMFSDHIKGRYPAITSLVSYGPCQWPTLGFVFDQYDKIEVRIISHYEELVENS